MDLVDAVFRGGEESESTAIPKCGFGLVFQQHLGDRRCNRRRQGELAQAPLEVGLRSLVELLGKVRVQRLGDALVG